MPSYKLTYFPARGRAEATRLAFAAGGIEWEDVRLPGATLFAGRADGSIATPFEQFPVLTVDGTPVGQSGTIFRFAARAAGLYPADAVQAAVAESICDQVSDIANGLATIFFTPAEESVKAAKLAEAKSTTIPRQLKGILKYLGGRPHIVGDSLTLADIALFNLVEAGKNYGCDVVEVAPELAVFAAGIAKHPKIAAYLEKRAAVEAAEKAASA